VHATDGAALTAQGLPRWLAGRRWLTIAANFIGADAPFFGAMMEPVPERIDRRNAEAVQNAEQQ
jgi:hypothetical protein